MSAHIESRESLGVMGHVIPNQMSTLEAEAREQRRQRWNILVTKLTNAINGTESLTSDDRDLTLANDALVLVLGYFRSTKSSPNDLERSFVEDHSTLPTREEAKALEEGAAWDYMCGLLHTAEEKREEKRNADEQEQKAKEQKREENKKKREAGMESHSQGWNGTGVERKIDDGGRA